MSTLKANELKAAQTFYQGFEPVWMTAFWFGDDSFDQGVDKLQELAIPQFNTCQIYLSGNDLYVSGVILGAPENPDHEVVGFYVGTNSWRDILDVGQVLRVGLAGDCPLCNGLGSTNIGDTCKKCHGQGLLFEVADPLKSISNNAESLEKHFAGLNRFARQVKETQQWIEDYKPVFFALDEGVGAAIEVVKELGIPEDHLWSSFYQYVNNELICVVTEFSEDPPSDGGSIGLYVTRNPNLEWKFIQIEGGYSCLDCRGEDEDCEVCGGAESTWEEWGPAGLSGDTRTLVEIFGQSREESTKETVEQSSIKTKFCGTCGEPYTNSNQKFCGSCGGRRPGS